MRRFALAANTIIASENAGSYKCDPGVEGNPSIKCQRPHNDLYSLAALNFCTLKIALSTANHLRYTGNDQNH